MHPLARPLRTAPVDVKAAIEAEGTVVSAHLHLSEVSDLRLSGCRRDVRADGSEGDGVESDAYGSGLVARRARSESCLGRWTRRWIDVELYGIGWGVATGKKPIHPNIGLGPRPAVRLCCGPPYTQKEDE